jgi:hypothetical protein
MSRMMKTLPVMGACVALVLVMGARSATAAGLNEGKEWLAWTPAERNVYVRGFIEGYWRGSQSTCRLADDLFEVNKTHRLGEGPSGRCEARLENYTKIEITDSGPDFSAYTTIITEFYTKHPEYQNIAKVHLLYFLSDRNFKTADQLYQIAVKGEIRDHY